jgi:hypothetical protein
MINIDPSNPPNEFPDIVGAQPVAQFKSAVDAVLSGK